jgi:hypothetical protein
MSHHKAIIHDRKPALPRDLISQTRPESLQYSTPVVGKQAITRKESERLVAKDTSTDIHT